MSSALQILTTRNFNGLSFDCYHEDGQDVGDFWATREQIGQLLGYKNPRKAIKDIHTRNRERLDKFSQIVVMATPTKRGAQNEPPLGNAQEAIVYNFKGLLEICRYSQQPKANAVIDWLWQISDELRQREIQASAQVCMDLQQEATELREQAVRMYALLALEIALISQRS